MKKVTNI